MRICGLLLVLGACWTSKSSPPVGSEKPLSNTAPADARAADAAVVEDDSDKLRVTGIDPPRGDMHGGTYVVIKGRRFIKDGPRNVKVYFGSRQGTVVRFVNDGELVVQAPGGKQDEVVDVLVVFDPGGQLGLPGAFTFVDKQP